MVGLLWWVAGASAGPLNANTATVEALDALPGLGPTKAAAIATWLRRHGPCEELSQLSAVPGIGAATLAALQGRLWCGPAGEQPPPRVEAPAVAPAASVHTVDINTASADGLTVLPGIVPARARAIVADRVANGPFASCAELSRVPGIGIATVTNLTDRCTVSGSE